MQWSLGICLLIFRESSSRLKRYLLHCAFDENRSNIIELISTNVVHCFYVLVALGTFATEITGYVILSIDVALNVWNAIKILKLHRKLTPSLVALSTHWKEERMKLSELALTEILEFVTPLVYITSLLVTLFGPNSNIMGNYGNGYWTFRPIEKLDKYVLGTFEMFSADLLSFFVGGFILWKFCSINLLKEACHQIKLYRSLIALALARSLNVVS